MFSDPKFWDDKNDTELLKIYRKSPLRSAMPANKLLALCLLLRYSAPLPPVFENHEVGGNFSIWSLKLKDLYQSIPE